MIDSAHICKTHGMHSCRAPHQNCSISFWFLPVWLLNPKHYLFLNPNNFAPITSKTASLHYVLAYNGSIDSVDISDHEAFTSWHLQSPVWRCSFHLDIMIQKGRLTHSSVAFKDRALSTSFTYPAQWESNNFISAKKEKKRKTYCTYL